MSDEETTPSPQKQPSGESGAVRDDASMVEKMREGSRQQRIEALVAVLMALAVIGAAWSSYQSTRWSTDQTKNFNASNASRVESTTFSTRGGQEVQVDVALFFEAVNAAAAGNQGLVDFYVERAPETLKPALDAWLATEPETNPDAASTPFALPEYQVEEFERADELEDEAIAANERALTANQRSDNYVLATVVFAAVLFLAGISSMFRWQRVMYGLVLVAAVGFALNSWWVATMPVTFTPS